MGKFFTFDHRDDPIKFGEFLKNKMEIGFFPILYENLMVVGNDAWHF